ncbi:MAG TPA: cupin domain-containing protein, partial [Kofleriaceae bacterium]
MKNRRLTIAATFAFALLAGIWSAQYASAQAPAGFKRVELTRHDIAGAKGQEAVLARAEFDAGAAVPKHTHPGDEVAYLLEGEVTLEMAGKPPVVLKPGDSLFVPGGTVHWAKNTGKGPAKILSTYIIE